MAASAMKFPTYGENLVIDEATIVRYSASLKGLTLEQSKLALSTTNLSAYEKELVLTKAGLITATDKLNISEAANLIQKNASGIVDAKALMLSAGLVTQKQIEENATIQLTAANIEEAMSKGLLSVADAKVITSALGVTGVNFGEAVSFDVLTKAIWKNIAAMAKWLVTNPLGWVILGAGAIFGLVKGIDALTESTEEAGEAATAAKEKYNEIESEIDSLNSKIEENNKLIAETNGDAQYDGYRKRLEAENKELERQIELERIKAQEAKTESDGKATKALTSETYEYDVKHTVNATGAGYTTTSQKGDIATATDWYLDQAEATGVVSDKLKDYIETIKEQRENLDLLNPESKELYDNLGLLIDRYIALYPNVKVTSDEMADSSENVNKMTDSLEGVTKTLSTLQGKYNELKSAQDEYNSTGAISAETMQKLIDNDLLKYLDFSSGKLKINTQALINEGEAAKVSAIQNLQNAAAHDLMVLAGTKTGEMSNTAKTAIENMGNAAETTGNQAETAAGKLLNFAAGAWAAAGLDPDTQSEDFMAKANAIISAYQNIANTIGGLTIRTPKGGGGDSSKDKPDYEDPTDAIIDRINLRHRELEQQEEYIENAREIAELENDYKKQISLTNDKLDIQRQKVDALKTANDELHQMAEDLRNSTPDWNEEEWFDSQGNATEAYNTLYNNSSKEEQERLKNQFEKISKIKEAWADNAEEIVGLNKTILENEKKIVELYYDRKIEDNEKEIEQLEAKLSIQEKSFDVINAMADAQREIDKELAKSEISKAYIDGDIDIFNDADYDKIKDKIDDINSYVDSETSRFISKINDLEEDEMYLAEHITAEYERRMEMKQQELELVKAEINLKKKQEVLDNVLAEKNVRILKDGKWQWTYNLDDAKQAMEDLADAQSDIATIERETAQKIANDQLQTHIDNKNKEIGAIEAFVEKVASSGEALAVAVQDIIAKLGIEISDEGGQASSGGSSGGTSRVNLKGVNTGINYSHEQIANMTTEQRSEAWKTASAESQYYLHEANVKKLSNTHTFDPGTGKWIKKEYAKGTPKAFPGWALTAEEGYETMMTNYGQLVKLGGGEAIFNKMQTDNLWAMSKMNIPNLLSSLPNLATKTIQSADSHNINLYGDVVVENTANVDDLLGQIVQKVKMRAPITNKTSN